MLNLYNVYDAVTNGYKYQSLFVVSLFSILCAIFVIISKNPIISVLFLIGLFFSISMYLMLTGMNFIGLSYLLVYVGAVTILFLFILMLINVRVSELLNNTSNSIPLAIVVGISLSIPVNSILPYNTNTYNTNDILQYKINESNDEKGIIQKLLELFNNDTVYYVTSKSWDGNLAENTHISSIGNLMYTSHSIWLIITSIILLLAMVGAIVITIKN